MKLGLLAICLVVPFAAGSAPAPVPQGMVSLKMIQSASEADRLEAKKDILEERKKAIIGLIDVIHRPWQDKDDDWDSESSARNLAVTCLGEMRAVEAIPFLVKLLSPPSNRYTVLTHAVVLSKAGIALVSIGEPSVPEIMKLLRSNANDFWVSPQARSILVGIESPEGAVFRLERAISSERDSVSKANLEENLKRLRAENALSNDLKK